VIDRLFTPREDWWDRSWLYCDHVITALHLEAFRFGRKRREGNDTTFNNIWASNGAGYVGLDDLIGRTRDPATPGGGRDEGVLMADSTDPYFENIAIMEHDLQVGDHLIIWNNFVYEYVVGGEWRWENALVLDVDSDPDIGGISRWSIMLQGHGTGPRLYFNYQDLIASHLRVGLADVQNAVRAATAANPTVTQVSWLGDPTRLVRWHPYEAFSGAGAWWVRIPKKSWPSLAALKAAIRKSIAPDDAAGAPNPPPFADSVYFPLFEPALSAPAGSSPCEVYLKKRAIDLSFRAPNNLRAVQVSGEMMPGLFWRSEVAPIPIIRPKIDPAP
jgi:hypothetical protein